VVHDVVEHTGKPCLIMEYLASESPYGAERPPIRTDTVGRLTLQPAKLTLRDRHLRT
jgi:hypothetical protein